MAIAVYIGIRRKEKIKPAINFSISFSTTFQANIGGTDFELQKVLDSIMIGILPLSAVIICFVLLNKKVKPMYILFGIIILGFTLTLLGLCG